MATRVTENARREGLALGDFALSGGRIYLRKTGNSAALDRALVAEVAIWLTYHAIVKLRAMLLAPARPRGPAIWFTPDLPHARYMVRSAARWAGIRIARTPQEADAALFFEDATLSVAAKPPAGRAFNFGCTDVSKSRVARTFASVFGYPLAVDPRTWAGDAVEKSELNGCHDGRIVRCPREPEAGKCYQRLIDTIGDDATAVDLRTQVVNGRAIAVWVKRRDPARRFLPPNLSVAHRAPDEIFSAAELSAIGRFARAMGADWCALDILRDRDGRIYVVDVNKTDAGPIIALPMREKLASTALLADALLAMVNGQVRPSAVTERRAEPVAIDRACD